MIRRHASRPARWPILQLRGATAARLLPERLAAGGLWLGAGVDLDLTFLRPPAPSVSTLMRDLRRFLTLHLSVPISLSLVPAAASRRVAPLGHSRTAASLQSGSESSLSRTHLPMWLVSQPRRAGQLRANRLALGVTSLVLRRSRPPAPTSAVPPRASVPPSVRIGQSDRASRPRGGSLEKKAAAARLVLRALRVGLSTVSSRPATAPRLPLTAPTREDRAARGAVAGTALASTPGLADRISVSILRRVRIDLLTALPRLVPNRQRGASLRQGGKAQTAAGSPARAQSRSAPSLRFVTLAAGRQAPFTAAAASSPLASPLTQAAARGTAPDVMPGQTPLMMFNRDRQELSLTFRRTGGNSVELQRQVLRIERQVEERAVREAVDVTLPALRARAALVEAEALSPRLLRSVTEHVSRAVARQMDLERYRRGR